MLKINNKNIKGLFRRSLSYFSYGMPNEALADMESLLEIDPANEKAKVELQRIKKSMEAKDRRTKSALQGLFSKGGLYTEKPNVVSLDFTDEDPTVYFDVKHGEEELGRIEMRLYKHIVSDNDDSQ